ncbi:MAG: hypothetical protein EOP04_15180, partial [Proteobacteria bacterium]
MKHLFALAFLSLMTACSASVNVPDLPAPNSQKAGADLPAPTTNAAQFNGVAFVPVRAVVRNDGFYDGYYQIQLQPAEVVNPCSHMPTKYFEVNAPKADPEAKTVLVQNGMGSQIGRYYDYANGQNLNIILSTGWFQLKNLASAKDATITLTVMDEYSNDYIQGT